METMEKNIGFGAASAQPSAPLPTAPPSYEEAIATAGGAPTHPPSVVPTPYPLGNAPVQMPMPYNQPPNRTTMHTPPVYPGSSHTTSQPHFNAENSGPQTEVRVMQHRIVYALGPNAVKMSCPTCRADIKTTTIADHQPSAHICCIVLCLLGCCLCSCLPYCMNVFMSVHHFCPRCKNYIGTWKG
ncbi:PREDICTED: lipopolysaccharide-induced tumor necrosis factor-alpha factor homolog isoform X2 [Vollenhovia emeryi]|uniref:lipopolysaccharide-induced tumor necrosis factor-alpha factor homolog isoform X2 n=1 Tax=Vollenhovia emeryi TaxID=411798 RepID=UPI0005F4A3B1|nr:PREDICTED: lipopolysaccharide-induced tumor necrosis factor-alpha factor homolog isoform X2 [Vollenhovia emeryi]